MPKTNYTSHSSDTSLTPNLTNIKYSAKYPIFDHVYKKSVKTCQFNYAYTETGGVVRAPP